MRRANWVTALSALPFLLAVSFAVPRSQHPGEASWGVPPATAETVALDNLNKGGSCKAPIEEPREPLNLPSSLEVKEPPGPCPSDMALVDGKHCPKAKQKCLDWMDDSTKAYARCREFEDPSVCKGERIHLRYCIDKLEAADPSGKPTGDISWTEAKKRCEAKGKRLCKETEWVFACEGEEMRPYPYGFVRNEKLCHFELKEGLKTRKGDLFDHRQPVTANPRCLSPFGVQNMVGNIDEWVELDKPHWSRKNGGRKMMSGLKGGWWGPLRNRCRPTTVDHDEIFHQLQTGFRCCADAD